MNSYGFIFNEQGKVMDFDISNGREYFEDSVSKLPIVKTFNGWRIKIAHDIVGPCKISI